MKHTSWNGHHGRILECQGEYEVIECEVCGFAHIIPFPAVESIEAMYRDQYYGEMIPDYIERHTQDQDWWHLVHSGRLEAIEALLPDGGKKLLDIGSGPGLFLQVASEKGWKGVGFEPSTQAWQHSTQVLGMDVRQEFFTEHTDVGEDVYNAVHMSDVLEHIKDPRALLQGVRKALCPGGVLCVAVPNDFNPIQTALREEGGVDPWWISAPDHINYFSFESLQRLLENAGFEVKKREASFPIDVFLLLGQDYVTDDSVGRRCHGWRMDLERQFAKLGMQEALSDVYQALAKHGLGRHVVMYATKSAATTPPETR